MIKIVHLIVLPLSITLFSIGHYVMAQDNCQTLIDRTEARQVFLERQQNQFESKSPQINQAVIDNIVIVRHEIFDETNPKESGRLYRLANDMHILTRENVIKRQLTFKTGDQLNYTILEESERILRRSRYLVDAWIIPFRQCDERVDILVMTRDVWSLTPKSSYTKRGDQEIFTLTVSEVNLFGQGNAVSVGKTKNEETDSSFLEFHSPYVMDTGIDFTYHITDGDTLDFQSAQLRKPYRSVYDRWRASLAVSERDRIGYQYYQGEQIIAYDEERSFFSISGGLSQGLRDNWVKRLSFGIVSREYDFDNVFIEVDSSICPTFDCLSSTLVDSPDSSRRQVTMLNTVDDRTQVYPWIGYQFFSHRYKKMYNIDKIYRVEDIFLGTSLGLSFGYSSESMGATSDQVVLNMVLRNTPLLVDKHLLRYTWSATVNWDRDIDEVENLKAAFNAQYYWMHSSNRRTYLALAADYGKNLTIDNVYRLGGNNGLRGYPSYYQFGDRRLVFSAEERIYSSKHYWNLVRVGGALFFDAGRAFFADDRWRVTEDSRLDDLGVLTSVGIGLRLASNQAELSSIVHVDLVFPLDKGAFSENFIGDEVDDMQFNITIKSTF